MRLPVLVLGAVGGAGPGLVEALLEGGYPVIAVDREREALEELRRGLERPPGVSLLVGTVDTEIAGCALADAVRQLERSPGAVVVSLGGAFERGRLLDHPSDRLRDKLDADLLPHLVAARHLLPLLAEGERQATYLLLGGPCAENPWAGYGHLSVSSAALRMLARVLREETLDGSVRVQQLAVCSPVRTASNRDCACPHWPSALEVGRRVVELLSNPDSSDPIVRFEPRRARPVAVSNSGPAERLSDVRNLPSTIELNTLLQSNKESS